MASKTGVLLAIRGITSAFTSRVANVKVLETTEKWPLTHMLEKQQLILFGRVARQPQDSVVRSSAFCPGTLRPATDRYVRKVGRPRLDWTTEVNKLASRVAGGWHLLEEAVRDPQAWKSAVEFFNA